MINQVNGEPINDELVYIAKMGSQYKIESAEKNVVVLT